MKHFITLSLLLLSIFSFSQSRILADGIFEEWEEQPVIFADAAGDGGTSGVDFGELKIYNDDTFIFFLIEVGTEINLQDLNDILIYLDTDNNTSTGQAINGIGAEIIYSFGNRSGFFYSSGNSTMIFHDDINLVSAPTVTSDRFEIAIKRDISIQGNSLFQGNDFKVVFRDDNNTGDILPAANEGVEYTFASDALDPLPDYTIQKAKDTNLRFLSYNVLSNGIFDPSRVPSFTRLLQAMQPEIIGFQEIYDLPSNLVANQVESMLPSGPDQQWYHAKEGPDCLAISRYPILESAFIQGNNSNDGNGAFLIDVPGIETNLLLIVAHPPCCANNVERQMEVDLIMQFLREAKDGNGPIPLEADAPIIILGDMNLVGDNNQLETLLTGNISDEAAYGPDFTPDWDGNNLLDAHPYSTGVPFSYTWYNEASSFSPGRLDFIIYSGSNLNLENSYALFTPGLPQDSLNTFNLLANDATFASDHLPLVADFELKNLTAQSEPNIEENFGNLKIHPNPSYKETMISFEIYQRAVVNIEVINKKGQVVSVLHRGILNPGTHEFQLDTSILPSGMYIVKIETAQFTTSQKVMVLNN